MQPGELVEKPVMERPEQTEACPDTEAGDGHGCLTDIQLSLDTQPVETEVCSEEDRVESQDDCQAAANDFEALSISRTEGTKTEGELGEDRTLKKTPSFGKTVRFQIPVDPEVPEERVDLEESIFPEYDIEEWTTSSFEELFQAEDWVDVTDDRLLRKKLIKSGPAEAACPVWGQEVTVKQQGVLEDRTVVEKDLKLTFVIGEGDVNQALEECALSMQLGEIALLLADSQCTYGLLGRDPDIPAWAPLLYQIQLLDIRDKQDPLDLPIPDRIRIGNQKRERGNFYFQRDEFTLAARSYRMALDVLNTRVRDGDSTVVVEEEEEVQEYRVKCLNNLAAAQIKLEQVDDALQTSQDVLLLDPQNVKALYRKGKLLSDKGEYQEAMDTLKKALKLEPSTKAIHVELSKLVKRQAGDSETQKWKPKPAEGMSWKLLLGALVVAMGSLVASLVLTARN